MRVKLTISEPSNPPLRQLLFQTEREGGTKQEATSKCVDDLFNFLNGDNEHSEE
jgi:hypothetical protein